MMSQAMFTNYSPTLREKQLKECLLTSCSRVFISKAKSTKAAKWESSSACNKLSRDQRQEPTNYSTFVLMMETGLLLKYS